jgi:TetR/AcrR family transcriptional regulator, cholesterol catabolism regulator
MKPAITPPADSADLGSVESEILRLARDQPELGQAAVARVLHSRNLRVSPSGVRYIWQRHGLETTVKRLQALVESSEEGTEALTDHQRQFLARGTLAENMARQSLVQHSDGGTEEPLERRQVILNAAAELFYERGYDGTSIRDIAGKVGLLPGSVYHYFPSKEDLYLAIHSEGITQVMERIQVAIATTDVPWERLRIACEVHVAGIVEGSPVDRITGRNLAMAGKHNLLDRITPHRKTYENLFRELIDALPVSSATDRSLLRLFLLGGMNWVCLWYRKGVRSPESIADVMLEMVRRGVED